MTDQILKSRCPHPRWPSQPRFLGRRHRGADDSFVGGCSILITVTALLTGDTDRRTRATPVGDASGGTVWLTCSRSARAGGAWELIPDRRQECWSSATCAASSDWQSHRMQRGLGT
jgi:hypothetical protein